jgi:uncharacterized protein (TIGR02271 family)
MEGDYPRVVGDGGIRGIVAGPSQGSADEVAIELDDGSEISVPATALTRQPDGTWYVHTDYPGRFTDLARQSRDETVVPVIAEDLEVGKRKRTTGKVRVAKETTEHDETVSMPLTRERAEVRRVLVDKPVDGPLPIRREGDTIILPIVEEVAVVQKHLVLKEELHIRRHRTTEQHDETVTLRQEHADVQRTDAEGREVVTSPPAVEHATHRPLLEPDPKAKPRRIRKNKVITPGA